MHSLGWWTCCPPLWGRSLSQPGTHPLRKLGTGLHHRPASTPSAHGVVPLCYRLWDLRAFDK